MPQLQSDSRPLPSKHHLQTTQETYIYSRIFEWFANIPPDWQQQEWKEQNLMVGHTNSWRLLHLVTNSRLGKIIFTCEKQRSALQISKSQVLFILINMQQESPLLDICRTVWQIKLSHSQAARHHLPSHYAHNHSPLLKRSKSWEKRKKQAEERRRQTYKYQKWGVKGES